MIALRTCFFTFSSCLTIAPRKDTNLPFSWLEVAGVTNVFDHLNVRAHDDLRFVVYAAKFLPPAKVSRVELVVEADSFFESNLPGMFVKWQPDHRQMVSSIGPKISNYTF